MSKTSGDGLSTAVQNWPTIRTSDGQHGGPHQRDSAGKLALPAMAIQSWPTPRSQKNASPDTCGKVPDELRGKKLNADWVESLQGLPVGWTQLTGAKAGENRIDRLRLLGNGVVPQTAEKAFRTLWEKLKKPQDIQQSFEDYI